MKFISLSHQKISYKRKTFWSMSSITLNCKCAGRWHRTFDNDILFVSINCFIHSIRQSHNQGLSNNRLKKKGTFQISSNRICQTIILTDIFCILYNASDYFSYVIKTFLKIAVPNIISFSLENNLYSLRNYGN